MKDVFKSVENAVASGKSRACFDSIFENGYSVIYKWLCKGHSDAWYEAANQFVLDLHSNPIILSRYNKYALLHFAAHVAYHICKFTRWVVIRFKYKSVEVLCAEAREKMIREIISRAWKKLRCFGRCIGVFVALYAEISLRPGNTAFLESMRRFDECAKRQRIV
jgi:hypothetical protein